MKIAAIVVLAIILVLVAGRVYAFFAQEQQLSASLADIQARLTKAKSDEANLQAEVQYLANPLNLEKELRARFNYKQPGETMIVIVPEQSSTATTTATTTGG
jgi:cell division protein FtsB